MAWYGINAACQRSGNVWLLDSRRLPSGDAPLIVQSTFESKIYKSALFGRLERRAAYLISNMNKIKQEPRQIIDNICNINLSGRQRMAINVVLLSSESVTAIVGGPGTGKTTICKIIAGHFNNVVGLSPTGKGADRLNESIGHQCYTIHRFFRLAFNSESDNEKLECIDYIDNIDLIIMDESGMIDTETHVMLLMTLHHFKFRGRLLYVGDTGQLPSIGPGRVLEEILSCVPYIKLDIVHRYDDALIGKACESFRSGHILTEQNDNYRVMSSAERSSNLALSEYVRLCEEYGTSNVRIITLRREDSAYINSVCLSYFKNNLHPIVCNRNSYREEIWNGQNGVMLKNGLLSFKNKTVSTNAISWSYSYSITCHRAQGGQWKAVVVWLPSVRFLSREWAYTAGSRPEQKLSLVLRDIADTERVLLASKPASRRVSLLGAFVKGEATWDSESKQ